ncbi:MAG: hypothetical protein JWO57_4265 [Pseudonocardiales bacterium]|nr:hypothetical protein [Pseudonocardiales bacterium]
MSERLSSADVSFFYLEGRTTPQHVGGLAVFRPPADGLDYDRLVHLVEQRISLVPRCRQKLRAVPGRIANPVWVDDPRFDITYHVRRSALPRPGTDAQLLEFCARIQSRLLDRGRPLWEMYLIEGLSGDRVAIITKTHHSMVDGVGAVDIAQVILDTSPQSAEAIDTLWMPEPEPTAAALVVGALAGVARRPTAVLDAARLGVRDIRASAARTSAVLTSVLASTAAAVRPAVTSPLHATIGQQRRIAIARTRLEDYRQVRRMHGGSMNDAALATVSGALRGWLLQRGEAVAPTLTVRARVPVSINDDADLDIGTRGTHVGALLVDLPVGEPDPVRRLTLLGEAMAGHTGSGRSVSADALVALSGLTPPTLHGLGARAAHGLTRRLFSLVVTNVPGPQLPLYAAGARMTEMFPILSLGQGQAMSIGLTSYDGGVYYGINADRDAVPDVTVLAALIEDSLAELVQASLEAGAALPNAAGAARATGRRATAGRATVRARRGPKA